MAEKRMPTLDGTGKLPDKFIPTRLGDPALGNAYATKAFQDSKGAASGVAPLDSGSRVPEANLPAGLAAATLSATYARKEETYINFAKQPGVDRTGITSSRAALQSILDAATPAAPVVVDCPAGKYYFDGPFTFDYHAVRFTGAGNNQTVWAWGGSFSGTAITIIANPPAPRRQTVPIRGIHITGPTASNTTGDCIMFSGVTGSEASLLTLHDLTILGFRDQVTYGNGAYIISFKDCNFTVWQRNALVCPPSLTGAGEGLKFTDCTFSQGKNGAAVKSSYQSAQWVFVGCHFDYNAWDIDLQAGNMDFIACYFEATDAEATTTERVKISYLNPASPKASFTNCYIFPLWTMTGTVRQFLRITGTPGTNEGWAPNVSFTDPQIYSAATSNVRKLILDEHTLISGSSAPKYSRVTVRNPNYGDQGDAFGVYRPLVYKDVDNREWQLAAGAEFEPQHSNKKQDWTGTTAHVFETIPRLLATDKRQITAGTLYIVRMPWTWSPFRASTWRLSAAIAAVGSSDATYARLAIFTGFSNLTNGGLTLFDHGGIGVTSGPNNIKSIDKVSNLGLDPEQNFYLGLLITGTTMPEVWGRNIPATPLLDRGNMSRPYLVGMLPGQATVGSIADVSTIQNSDFVPWIGLEPVVYA